MFVSYFVPALLSLAFAVAAFYYGSLSLHFVAFTAILVIAACFSAGCFLKRERTENAPGNAMLGLLLLLWSWFGLTTALSPAPFVSLITLASVSVLPLTVFTLFFCDHTALAKTATDNAGRFLICIVTGLAIWSIIHYAILRPYLGQRVELPFMDSNILGALFMLGILPALSLSRLAQTRPRKTLLVITAGLLFAGLLTTESRGALLSLIFGLGIYLPLHGHIKKISFKKTALNIGIALGIFVAITAVGNGHLIKRFAVETPAEDTLTERVAIWRDSARLITDDFNFLTGGGLGTFFLRYPSVRTPGIDRSHGSWAHSDPLQIFIETGLIGLILYYGLFAIILIRSFKALKALPHEAANQRLLIVACLSSLVAFFVHSHISYHFYVPGLLIPFGVLLAVWNRIVSSALADQESKNPIRAIPKMAGVFWIAACLGLMLPVLSASAGLYFLNAARDSLRSGDDEAFAAALTKAGQFGPGSFIHPQLDLADLNLRVLSRAENLPSPERQAFIDETRALLDAAQSQNPLWAEIDVRKAQLALLSGQPNAAADLYRTAIGKNQMHVKAREGLAQILLSEGAPPKEALIILKPLLGYPISTQDADRIRTQLDALWQLEQRRQSYLKDRDPAP